MGAGLLSPFGAGAGLLVPFASGLPLGTGLGVLAGGGDGDGSCLGAFGSSFACGGGASDDAAEEDLPASPGAKRNRSCPTVTVSSSFASSSVIVPEAGALTDTSICERGVVMSTGCDYLRSGSRDGATKKERERERRNPRNGQRDGKDVIEGIAMYIPCRSR